MIIMNRLVATFTVLGSLIGVNASSGDHLISTFTHPEQRIAIASFIDNVLRQIPSDEVLNLVDQIKQDTSLRSSLDDAQFYEKIRVGVMSLKGRLSIFKIINLINFQKQLLGKQIRALLGQTEIIQNCLEIGTPGTYSSAIRDRINGKIYVLTEEPKATDILQAYSLNPLKKFKGYDEFIALNDYAPVSTKIPDHSIDLVICTIGLHHAPVEKLDAFIDSIRRVLRPGGIFILREHNAYSPELVSLAYAAHSIYNAIIPEETVDSEMREIRNFQSLNYWKSLLETHGFSIDADEHVQDGDSTLNTFIKCTKKCITLEDQKLNASIQAQQYPDYSRDQVQTYLTTPEWNNVDAAQHYGEYINTVPFYEFPYMAHVKTFWKTFFNSWSCAAKEKGGNVKLLLSPSVLLNYMPMNIFIGCFMTVEHSAKALVSLPIRLMFSGAEATTLLALVHDPLDEITQIDPSIVIKQKYDGNIKLVSISRYLKFLVSVKKMVNSSVEFIKIANNENILCKVRYKNGAVPLFKPSWEQKFTWQMPTIPEYTYAAYLIPVNELKEFIQAVSQSASELLYIHDF